MREIDPKLLQFSVFADTIRKQKYAHELEEGLEQWWPDTTERVITTVMKSVKAKKSLVDELKYRMAIRQFIPGGRYLFATGRLYHQVNNCFLFRLEDSREGWAEHLHKSTMSLMSGGGIGAVYSALRGEGAPIRKTGGTATGPLALTQMTNECGRGIMNGGNRRAAIWAGLHWWHPDIFKFITMKNWTPEVREMKAKDFNFPATMDMTNISVCLDDDFFEAYNDPDNPRNSQAHQVYWTTVRQMLKTAEPGFSIDTGKNSGEDLRNAPITDDTYVLTGEGYKQVREIVGFPTDVFTGLRYAKNVVFKKTGNRVPIVEVKMTGGRSIKCDPSHPFLVEKYEGAGKRRKLVSLERVSASNLEKDSVLHTSFPVPEKEQFHIEGYTLGYLYGDGSFGPSGNAEVTFCTEDSKKCALILANSQYISSVNYNDSRGYVRAHFKVSKSFKGRTKKNFPEEVFEESNSFIQSFIAGLFDSDGNYEPTQKRIRVASVHREFLEGVRRLLEQQGILSNVSKAGTSTYGNKPGWQLVVASEYNRTFSQVVPTQRVVGDFSEYKPYRTSEVKVISVEPAGNSDVYCCDVGVDEHSFMAEGVIISNCTEITSRDDSDVCNLFSLNLARIDSLEDMKACVEVAMAFGLAGTIYSDIPFSKVDQVRSKNRRLGMGLMGIHEWLVARGKKYGPDSELEEYMKVYASSRKYAKQYADEWDLNTPVKTRAIAPTGTIGIIGETTTGIEPMLCVAYKRRYLKARDWHYQYVIEPVAKKLVEEKGVDPDSIEDAYSLAEEPERRVAFQAWVQQYVDHAISSTINLPEWGSELNNEDTVRPFGNMLMKYLPNLRGITCYPDGARAGQPLTAVKYKTAVQHVGNEFSEVVVKSGDVCDLTKGGSCGE